MQLCGEPLYQPDNTREFCVAVYWQNANFILGMSPVQIQFFQVKCTTVYSSIMIEFRALFFWESQFYYKVKKVKEG